MKPPVRCRACGADIQFVKTKRGKTIPVNYDTWDGEEEFKFGKHIAHFATCPQADEFRKKGKSHDREQG